MKQNTSVIKEILFLYYSYKRVKKTWTILKDLMDHIELQEQHQIRKPIVIATFLSAAAHSSGLRRRGLWVQPPAGVQRRSSSRGSGVRGGATGFYFA